MSKPEKDIRQQVRKAYGATAAKQMSCCPPRPSCCDKSGSATDLPVPEAELGLSCGNPVAFSHLSPGQVVLDLGSGAGKDVFLAAQKVGRSGRAIGVDMTDEMLALARRNAENFRRATGLDNVEFRKGYIEDLPVEGDSIDVVISNCVINLSPDKPKVFREVFRVLKNGGKMVVSDIVLNRALPPELKDDDDLYSACIAGALLREDYLRAIRQAGFARIEVLADKTYAPSLDTADPVTCKAGDMLAGVASSVTVMAVKA